MPSFTTITTWVQKCGLDKLEQETKNSLQLKEVCKIIDESISVNGEKLLLILKLFGIHSGHAPQYGDATVERMTAKKNRSAEDVAEEIKEVMANSNSNTEDVYFLGDGGKNLVKGANLAGYTYHIDCGHAIANILKAVYGKCKDFEEFFKVVGSTRHYSLTDVAYLMPPSMRSNSRFMNISIWVYWAKCMNDNTYKLNKKEKYMYSFLEKNACLVEELHEVLSTISSILKILKNEGLCTSTANACITLANHMMVYGERPWSVGDKIIRYLRKELSKMKDPTIPRNISSDIIESLFGFAKCKMPKNKRFGFTPGVLLLPLKLHCDSAESLSQNDVKTMLENKRMSDIEKWRKANLMQSQMKKRKGVLSEKPHTA